MRWYVLVIAGYAALTLDMGLRTLLSYGAASPDWVLVLSVFIALLAPERAAIWAALGLGALVDMTLLHPGGGAHSPVVLIGPTALGYTAAAIVVVKARSMLYRKTPASLAVLVLLGGVAAQLVVVGLLTARGLPWLVDERIAGWNVADQLVQRFVMLLYSGVLAIPFGWLLFKTKHFWGFTHAPGTVRS